MRTVTVTEEEFSAAEETIDKCLSIGIVYGKLSPEIADDIGQEAWRRALNRCRNTGQRLTESIAKSEFKTALCRHYDKQRDEKAAVAAYRELLRYCRLVPTDRHRREDHETKAINEIRAAIALEEATRESESK